MVLPTLLPTVAVTGGSPRALVLGQNWTWTHLNTGGQEGQCWHGGKIVKWVSFTVFKKCSDHYFRHFEFECSQAIRSHLFTMVSEAPMLFLGLILPTAPTLLAPNYPPMTAHVILLATTGDHHLHCALARMKWPMGYSLDLMMGTERCPSVGSPALSCFTLVGWAISGHSSACPSCDIGHVYVPSELRGSYLVWDWPCNH